LGYLKKTRKKYSIGFTRPGIHLQRAEQELASPLLSNWLKTAQRQHFVKSEPGEGSEFTVVLPLWLKQNELPGSYHRDEGLIDERIETLDEKNLELAKEPEESSSYRISFPKY